MAPVPKAGHKTLSIASNLANLLPTGTVLAFEALTPSFSNNGSCLPAHRYLTSSVIIFFSLICFLTSFTDSFTAENGKLYYGIATIKGLYIFNNDKYDDNEEDHDNTKKDQPHHDDEEKGENKKESIDVRNEGDHFDAEKVLAKYGIRLIDFVHAFSSLLVFLVFAMSNTDVHNCFFPRTGANGNALIMNLPLGVAAAASFLFMLFPTRRRGIGFADKTPRN